jgi:Na+/pantothenate symporter
MSLGALLYIFAVAKYQELTGDMAVMAGEFPNKALMSLADQAGMSVSYAGSDRFPPDGLFPLLAIKFLHPVVGFSFVIGLIAAAYSSADSALTALTTSFCVDFLGFEPGDDKIKTRMLVHVGFSLMLLLTIIIFNEISNRAIIDRVFTAAGYTYGPLLGLFSFGLLTHFKVRGRLVPIVCIISPVIAYLIKSNESLMFDNYSIGHEILLINGALTFIGLLIISKRQADGESSYR